MKVYSKRTKVFWRYFVVSIIVLLLSFIPVQLAIAYALFPTPQAILTLGGGREREEFAAQLAQSRPSLEVWVSTGINPEESRAIFQAAGIASERVYLDRRAVDTVTNFTSLVEDFEERDIGHIYLITSDFHMARAKAIAIFVLGSRGIAFTPLSVPSNEPTETWLTVARDVGRSLFWIVTGRTGSSLKK